MLGPGPTGLLFTAAAAVVAAAVGRSGDGDLAPGCCFFCLATGWGRGAEAQRGWCQRSSSSSLSLPGGRGAPRHEAVPVARCRRSCGARRSACRPTGPHPCSSSSLLLRLPRPSRAASLPISAAPAGLISVGAGGTGTQVVAAGMQLIPQTLVWFPLACRQAASPPTGRATTSHHGEVSQGAGQRKYLANVTGAIGRRQLGGCAARTPEKVVGRPSRRAAADHSHGRPPHSHTALVCSGLSSRLPPPARTPPCLPTQSALAPRLQQAVWQRRYRHP